MALHLTITIPAFRWFARITSTRASLVALAASGVLVCSQALAQRVPVGSLPSGPANMPAVSGAIRGPEVVSGRFGQYTVNGNVGTIRQNDPAGILRWATFDIGQGASMIFEQPSSSSVVLNRVDGGAFQNKTVIEGLLKANGQVYIYNPNGVIIGRTGQVDVNTLLATTLSIDNSRFLRGLLSPATDLNAQLAIDTTRGAGDILIEGTITAADGGRIILAAPNVTNQGRLTADSGQVVLAAGKQVFLASSSDANMRGLLVEVRNSDTFNGAQNATSTATNSGEIRVGTGNATMVGYAVNQQGLVSATTTVENNGSIWLLARDGVERASTDTVLSQSATRGGQLTLGSGSRTEVALVDSGATLADSDATLDKKSQVLLSGETIRLQGGTSISARAGEVDIFAQSNPTNYEVSRGAPTRSVASNQATVILEAGSSIDVSGMSGTVLPMESLSMAVELRGSQLADSPLLRNGPLRGQTVYVDVRKGTAIANIAGDLALREYSLGQLAARGGSVQIFADGGAVFERGASIDVSGGWVDYASGKVRTSMLRLANGKLVDIGSASKDAVYTKIINPDMVGRRGVQAGYREGYSAGTVAFEVPTLTLDGTITGTVQRGPWQRDPLATNWPIGATLLIGDTFTAFNTATGKPFFLTSDPAEYGYLGDVTFAREGQAAGDSLGLDLEKLAASGIEHVKVATAGDVGFANDVPLSVAGTLGVSSGGTVTVGHSVVGSGAKVLLGANELVVESDGVIDVAGRWINDLPTGSSRSGGRRDSAGRLEEVLATAGGDILLQGATTVELESGARLDVSGGAQLTSAGKVVAGKAGTISLISSGAALGLPAGLAMHSGVTLAAYGLSSGGTLKLQARDVFLGGDSPFDGGAAVAGADALYDLWLADDFFQQGGFAKYEITAGANAFVRPGAAIAPRESNWQLPRDYRGQASGSMAFAEKVVLPLADARGSRAATTLSLVAKEESLEGAGQLTMASGSSIVTDPGGSVTLRAGQQLTVDGSIETPGGDISLELSKTTFSDTETYLERFIWVGDTATLAARGSAERIIVGSRGVATGEVLDGGTIFIGGTGGVSAGGYVVVADGALLDVSGVSGSYRLKSDPRLPVDMASAGGSIEVRARESLYFNGVARAFAGGERAAGGSFTAVLDRMTTEAPPTGFPDQELNLALKAGAVALPSGVTAGDPLDALAGNGQVSATMLTSGGFDSIRLKSQEVLTLDFQGGTSLALAPRVSLTLDAPVLAAAEAATGARAALSADYVNLGNSDPLYQTEQASSWGGATLAASATMVDLTGNWATRGFGLMSLNASDAVRLVGVGAELSGTGSASSPTQVTLAGALRTQGQLDIVAGQVYPGTLTQYQVDVTAPSGQTSTLSLRSNGTNPAEPLSAGGSLTLVADDILQAGTVRAPLGELMFSARRNLVLDSGSITSVAASSLIPFGRVLNGREWNYYFGEDFYMTVSASEHSGDGILALPEKRIVTEAASSVDIRAGARVDLSGGGDLYAAEFLPGPGGSKNVLANDGKTFAILPGYTSAYAPVDPQNSLGSGLKVGDRIYLAGGNGLAAGYYTLLPAEYALLPGAYSITAVSGSRDVRTAVSTVNRDGSLVVPGRKTIGNTGLGDSRWSNYLLTSGSIVRTKTEFGEYRASSFFTDPLDDDTVATSRLPADGGTLIVDAGNALLLDGDFLLKGSGGEDGRMDIVAPDIVIVSSAARPSDAGTVRLNIADLQRIDVGSFLFGGRHNRDGTVTVKSDTVTLANDRSQALRAPDITLAALDRVTVRSGAAIHGSGSTRAETLTLAGEGAAADGALLRVTGEGLGEIIRTAPAQAVGTLDVQSGALVRGEGGVNLDATLQTFLAQAPEIGAGGGFAFGTGKIVLGDAVPAGTPGVVFGTADLLGLSGLGQLSMTSYQGFDFYGNVNLGGASMSRLTLRGAVIQGWASTASLAAQTVVLANSGRDTLAGGSPSFVAGQLTVSGDRLLFGSALTADADAAERVERHDFDLAGFALVSLNATQSVTGHGLGLGALRALNGNIRVAAPVVTAAGGAKAQLEAVAGNLTTLQSGTYSATGAVGGSLTLAGLSINHGGTAVVSSGKLALESSGDIVLEQGSTTSAAGTSVTLGSQTVDTPGGSVSLSSTLGAVIVGDAATIDVSGAAWGGTLTVSTVNTALDAGSGLASGRLVLSNSAVLRGGGLSAEASFSLDAGDLSNIDSVNRALNVAGFGGGRTFRARSGSLALNETIRATDILVSVDQGDLSVAGTLDARGASGGTIKLYAAQATAGDGTGNVRLESTARLLASATTAGEEGGGVEVGTATTDGSMPTDKLSGSVLIVEAGALIDVSGAGGGQGGRTVLRVPRIGSDEGQDVAIDGNLANLVAGASDAMIEAFKVYDATNISATETATNGTWFTETANFVSGNKAAILAALGSPTMRLQPGLEIRSASDLLVSVNENKASTLAADRGWNLNTWRFDGEPISLTLRATDQLEVRGSINDGFVRGTVNRVAMPDWAMDSSTGQSASYRFAAAADFTAANPLAVVSRADESGDFKLSFFKTSGTATDQPVALIRTGTGNIDIAAGHDVVLGSVETSQSGVLAGQIYTAGRPSTLVSGFTAPSIALNTRYGATTSAAAVFPTGGGDLNIFADHSMQGVATSQLFTDWLFRQGQVTTDASGNTIYAKQGATTYATAWWTQFDRFNQNLATFGGGDIRVTALSGDVLELSASAASTAYVSGTPGTATTEQGGGNVSVAAGGDIRGGAFYAQKGDVSLIAGGDITRSERVLDYEDTSTGDIIPLSTLPIIGLGDGVARVTAGGNAGVETVFNPTLIPQTSDNASSPAKNSRYSYFGTYADASGLSLLSLTGDATLGNSINALALVNRTDFSVLRFPNNFDSTLFAFYTYYPGTVSVVAMGGDINIPAGFSMAPAADGQLTLLAKSSVLADASVFGNDQATIVMVDRDPALMPSTSNPAGYNDALVATWVNALNGEVKGLEYHTSGGLHAADTASVKVVADEGDIRGRADVTYSLILPKAAEISAGRDVTDFGVYLQHLRASDVSLIQAGRDIVLPTEADGSSPVALRIGGPGRLELLAGGDIDFGNSQGLVSAGNSDNAYLPAVADYGTDTVYDEPRYGADLLLATGIGQGLMHESFLAARSPDTQPTSLTEAARIAVLDEQGRSQLRRVDGSFTDSPTAADVWAAFMELPQASRQSFYSAQASSINDAFFAAVVAQVKAEPRNLTAFDAIISSYVQAGQTTGDINIFGSQIKTLRRGNIDIFTPSGSLFAGLVSTPANILAALDKTPSNLGIFTISGGEIRILVGQDISVNQGRIFTLGGGDISLVSQYQDIDAGRGAKTAASAPPPTLEFDAFGNARVDISNSVSGSGIRTLQTGGNVPTASLYAVSPRGTFDAGDAGVGSSGNVNIVAATVLNANNINASGSVSGTPAVSTSGLGGSVAAPTVQTTKAEDVARSAMGGRDILSKAFTFLTVDVLGFGTEQSDRQDTSTAAQTDSPSSRPADTSLDSKAEGGKRRKELQ